MPTAVSIEDLIFKNRVTGNLEYELKRLIDPVTNKPVKCTFKIPRASDISAAYASADELRKKASPPVSSGKGTDLMTTAYDGALASSLGMSPHLIVRCMLSPNLNNTVLQESCKVGPSEKYKMIDILFTYSEIGEIIDLLMDESGYSHSGKKFDETAKN